MIPVDTIRAVLSFLPLRQAVALGRVCHTWREAAQRFLDQLCAVRALTCGVLGAAAHVQAIHEHLMRWNQAGPSRAAWEFGWEAAAIGDWVLLIHGVPPWDELPYAPGGGPGSDPDYDGDYDNAHLP